MTDLQVLARRVPPLAYPRISSCPMSVARYGVRLLGTRTLGDQLGLVLSPKSKIKDGSDIGTWGAHVTSVADFR